MSTYAMTYRATGGQRVTQYLLAASLVQAWDCAFDLAERLQCAVCGFGVAPANQPKGRA